MVWKHQPNYEHLFYIFHRKYHTSRLFSSASLIINELTKSSTPHHADNPINALTHAFHPAGVFEPEYIHKTTEIEIAPASMMIAQSTKTNVMVTPPDLGPYSHLGDIQLTRTGPYWEHFPYHRYSSKENTSKSLGSIVNSKYLLMRPKQPKD